MNATPPPPGAEPNRPRVVAPPPLIFLAFIGLGAGLQWLWPLPRTILPLRPIVGPLLVTAGFVLSVWSVMQFVRHGTNPDPYHPTTTLITSGPFRFSRNPIYVAFALMHIGIGWSVSNLWMLYAVLPALGVIYAGVIRPEERYLEGKFGEKYDRYRRTVRRWL